MWRAILLTFALIIPTAALGFGDECQDFRGLGGLEKKIARPEPPLCASSYGLGEVYNRMCVDEMQTYRDKISRYLKCLKWESDEAIKEHNKAVQTFNVGIQ